MIPKKSTEKSYNSNPKKVSKGVKYLTIFSILSFLLIVFLVVWKIQSDINEVYTPSKIEKTIEQPAPATSDLIGQWRRTDGGYVIEIRNVNTHGMPDVSYYNPNPINVSQAEVKDLGGMIGVFLELWDKGYPGSTYELTYDPIRDLLYGTYFTPVAGQSFEVIFTRIKN